MVLRDPRLLFWSENASEEILKKFDTGTVSTNDNQNNILYTDEQIKAEVDRLHNLGLKAYGVIGGFWQGNYMELPESQGRRLAEQGCDAVFWDDPSVWGAGIGWLWQARNAVKNVVDIPFGVVEAQHAKLKEYLDGGVILDFIVIAVATRYGDIRDIAYQNVTIGEMKVDETVKIATQYGVNAYGNIIIASNWVNDEDEIDYAVQLIDAKMSGIMFYLGRYPSKNVLWSHVDSILDEIKPPPPKGCIIAFLASSMGASIVLPSIRQLRSHLPQSMIRLYYSMSEFMLQGVQYG